MGPRIKVQIEGTGRCKWKKYFKETHGKLSKMLAMSDGKRQAKRHQRFPCSLKMTAASFAEADDSSGVLPPRVPRTHQCLETLATSLEFGVRWFHLGPHPGKFIPGSPRRISLQHRSSLTTWLCNLSVTEGSQLRPQSVCLTSKWSQRPEIWNKFYCAYKAKLTRSQNASSCGSWGRTGESNGGNLGRL